jgi:hypothetical protein
LRWKSKATAKLDDLTVLNQATAHRSSHGDIVAFEGELIG